MGEDTRSISAYLGIPFAKVPRRFEAPIAALSWKPDIKPVMEYGPSCYQTDDETFPGFPGALVRICEKILL